MESRRLDSQVTRISEFETISRVKAAQDALDAYAYFSTASVTYC